MALEALAAFANERRRWMALLALLSTFAGVALAIDRPKGTILEWLALPLLAMGGAVFAWVVWPRAAESPRANESLATRFLHRVTFGGRLIPLFPAMGVGILIADLAYNFMLSATPALYTEDTIVLLTAGSLLGYGFVPGRFSRERDFVLVFFLCLSGILVLPLLAARTYYADFERSVDFYSWIALAPQTSGILHLIGVANEVHAVPGSTAPGLTFQPQQLPTQVTVVITTACSGLYSFGIFAAAFVAFVTTEYSRLSRRVGLLLALGLVTAYIANVLRMVVIVLVGYYTDTPGTDLQNMLVAHSSAGWIIFLSWIALFWAIVFRFLTPITTTPGPYPERKKRGVLCGICGEALTPTLSGQRCECGRFYHVACAAELGECPKCHRATNLSDTTRSPVVP